MKKLIVSGLLLVLCGCAARKFALQIPAGLKEAPTGFDLTTNGFESQAQMNIDAAQFEESAKPGVLGPFFNSLACVDCHLNPTTGGNSAVFEHRVSPDDKDDPIASATLIHDASLSPDQQQRAPVDAINVLRSTLSIFGDSLVERMPDSEFAALAKNGGTFVRVPILENPGHFGIGRFGHKTQHASLLSFAADAAFNEMGEGNRFLPDPSNGIEDNDNATPGRPEDIDNYAAFMRSLRAPSRGIITAQAIIGQAVFEKIGCNLCHVETLYTDKEKFHPFGDYLLHNVGTGDGIAQAGAPANVIRTAPLWGLRAKARFLHDGRVFDIPSAIRAHSVEAKASEKKYRGLSFGEKQNLLTFLLSL